MRALTLAAWLLVGCWAGPPPGPPLPAPYDTLPLRTSSTTLTVENDALVMRYGEGVSWRAALGRVAADLEGAGWARDAEMPLPGGMAVTFSKDGHTTKALAGGSTGKVKVVLTLE